MNFDFCIIICQKVKKILDTQLMPGYAIEMDNCFFCLLRFDMVFSKTFGKRKMSITLICNTVFKHYRISDLVFYGNFEKIIIISEFTA